MLAAEDQSYTQYSLVYSTAVQYSTGSYSHRATGLMARSHAIAFEFRHAYVSKVMWEVNDAYENLAGRMNDGFSQHPQRLTRCSWMRDTDYNIS
eukprot:SAG11_NODE_1827_length_4202_cov_2.276627_1_plen_94_part_00